MSWPGSFRLLREDRSGRAARQSRSDLLPAGRPGPALVPDRTAIKAPSRDNGISRATAYRYADEVTAVLVAGAPGLPAGRWPRAPRSILDGKVIPRDRCREERRADHHAAAGKTLGKNQLIRPQRPHL